MRVSRNAFTAAKAWRADNAAELLRAYRRAVALVGPKAIALQELIPGDGTTQFSYAAVWDRGQPCASLVARRTRQYPIDFGFTSTFVETIEQSAVEEAACRFLSPLRFNGLVEAEFKYDARDGRYKLLDVNPRIWTWIALGAAAGVDFPLIQWRLAMGQEVTPARALPGRAWMHASRDSVAALQLVAGRRLAPSNYLGSWLHPLTFAAAAADDPLPGILDLPVALTRVLRRHLSACFGRPVAAAPRIETGDSVSH
jgi:predicted ATP-grasp superfamily ATP-dependent carboligase